MLEDCPHCYTRMIPMADGRCPSCQGDTDDCSSYDPDLAMVTVAQRQTLPNCCLVCGQTTDREVVLTLGSGSDVGTNIAISIAGIALSLLAGFGFAKTGGGDKQHMTIRVPVCPRCKGHPRLEPRHLDFQNYQAKFLAHRRFGEAIKELRRA